MVSLSLSCLQNCERLSFIWPPQLEVIKASNYVRREVIDRRSRGGETETVGLMAVRGVAGPDERGVIII